MRRALVIGVLGILVLPGGARAEDQCTIAPDSVRTWPIAMHGREYEAHPATPNYEGTTGLFHLPSAYTLPKRKLSFSLFRNNLDRDPKDEDISIHGVTLGYGATDRLELFGSYGLQNRVDADALFQPGFVSDFPFVSTPWQTGPGDVKLGLKYKLRDDYLGETVGLALRGFVKLGTADQAKGLGTGKTSVGLDLLLSKSLGHVADIHGGIGYQFNTHPDQPTPLEIGDALNWGVGLNIPACKVFQVQAEVTGAVFKGAAFAQTNPVDLVVGPVFWIKGVFIRPAISHNLHFDDRGLNSGIQSSTGLHISIGYHPGTACCAIAAPPPPQAAANRPPTVTCEAERSTIAPGETVVLRAAASDPDRNPLTFSWTTSAGRITGAGPDVTLETSGVKAPASIVATVRVADGHGGNAVANCPVLIPATERRPETMTCESAGFPVNLARLNNVDKACLDDVASRLRQDPRSRVIATGYADSAESRPTLLAQKRAEAAKAYLVTERGIEEARVSVRSTEGLPNREPSASRKNRRVEVMFVPYGAKPPGE